MDKPSLTLGWLVGRQIAGQRKAVEKQPIAYLYNGVQLPPLPEGKYPHLCIVKSWTDYRLFMTSMPLVGGVHTTEGTEYCVYTFADGDDNWSFGFEGTGVGQWAMTAIWTNTDILNEDGSVYLATSEPIPVYE